MLANYRYYKSNNQNSIRQHGEVFAGNVMAKGLISLLRKMFMQIDKRNTKIPRA